MDEEDDAVIAVLIDMLRNIINRQLRNKDHTVASYNLSTFAGKPLFFVVDLDCPYFHAVNSDIKEAQKELVNQINSFLGHDIPLDDLGEIIIPDSLPEDF